MTIFKKISNIRSFKRRKDAVLVRWKNLKIVLNEIRYPKLTYSLIIFDDLFPHLYTAFRIAEYSAYLHYYSDALVYTTTASFEYVKESRSLSAVLAEYELHYPHLHGRVMHYNPFRKLRGRIGYVTFLHNAFKFVGVMEKNKLPFIFQLYPGGMFRLNEAESDKMLRRVCASPYLRQIIVTQNVTYNYLIKGGFCSPEQVTLVYGVVIPIEKLISPLKKLKYKINKPTLDLCFVAGKYMPQGRDKGYDIFIAAAKVLIQQFADLRFHVVGPYNETDIPIDELLDRIYFYGTKPTSFFPDFYNQMDAIISPNRSFVLNPGAFDGFPTACCVEAGACGVAIFCTDDLGQNLEFKDNVDIVLLESSVDDVVEKIHRYLANYKQLVDLGQRSKQTVMRVFNSDQQVAKRLLVIDNQLVANTSVL